MEPAASIKVSMDLSVSVAPGLPAHSDKCIFPASLLKKTLDTFPQLPHPLVFSLDSVLVGVKEFTAPEHTVLVPQEVFDRLPHAQNGTVSCAIAEVPKATFLQLKPAQFYPHVTNWKYYLESFLSSNYTTLSTQQAVSFWDASANTLVCLTVQQANEPSVVVVDTDIALDMVPLNDVMAAQQLRHDSQLAALENVPVLAASAQVMLRPFSVPAAPVLYKIDLRKHSAVFEIELTTADDVVNVDLVAGLDKFVSLENFSWCTMAQDATGAKAISINPQSDLLANYMNKHVDDDNCWLYVVPFAWETPASATLQVRLPSEEPQTGIAADSVECPNCRVLVDRNSFVLHETFCLRNNVVCSCGQVFRKQVPSTHWHCDQCSATGNSALHKYKHAKLYHAHPYRCESCRADTPFGDFFDLVEHHKSSSCPAKLHECVFCHLVVPQGAATFEDRFLNLTHHENECGNKTTECYKCGKVLRTKELHKHMRMHQIQQDEENARGVATCTNTNCVSVFRQAPTNPCGLCDTCFGPLYSGLHDPTLAKLRGRIERRYVLQMTKGCGNTWCTNGECATTKRLDFAQAAHRVQALLRRVKLPGAGAHSASAGAHSAGSSVGAQGAAGRSEFWFCVSEGMQEKRRLVEALIGSGYGETVVYRAVAAHGPGAETWLQANA